MGWPMPSHGLRFGYIQEEMGRSFPMPFRLVTDSTTAKVFAMGSAQRSTMLHVDQRQQWVQLCRDKRVVVVDHESGATNLADINTKSFQRHPGKFKTQRSWIQFSVPANAFSTGADVGCTPD